jgi:tetratricopeptide (TPR) repeat protein
VVIAQFYPLEQGPSPHTVLTSYRRIGSRISGASFGTFLQFFRGAIRERSGRANFWLPPKTQALRNCVGHALLQGPPDRSLAARVLAGKLSHGLAGSVAFGNASWRGSRPDKRPCNSEADIEDMLVGSVDVVASGGAQAQRNDVPRTAAMNPLTAIGPGALAVAKSFSEPNRSPALRILAEAQTNADDPAQALEATKSIDYGDERLKALLAVAKAQTRAGQRGPAGVSFGEALQIAQTVRFSKDTLTESIAIAEAEADRIDEARALVEQIQDRTSRGGALAAIARALARAGRAPEAREAAEQARTSSPFPELARPREAIIQGFAEGGHIAEAVETARTMERQEGVLYTVAVSLGDAGNAKAALQLAQAMAPGDRLQAMAPREGLHVPALLKIAHTLRDAGADAEAASALREALNVITAEPDQYSVPDELVSLSYALPD